MITSETTIEVTVNDLQPGMYVSDLDRPWLETPYPIQGILIQSQKDIDVLKRYCAHVYVDIDRSEQSIAQKSTHNASVNGSPNATSQDKPQQYKCNESSNRATAGGGMGQYKSQQHKYNETESFDTLLQRVKDYTDIRSAEQEIPAATKAYNIASTLLSDISVNIGSNIKFDIRAVREVVDTLCESIIRNPDAALLLAQLKTTGKELYDNAIKSSVHLLAFGRHLGLPRKELLIVGLGGLLMDIGKQRLPKDIQTKRSFFLKPNERKLMHQHIFYGEEIVTHLSDVPAEVVTIVLQHHERENGNGYPQGLRANQLHPYGRMAAIVDCYEELIWGQPGTPGLRPFHALKELRSNAQNGLSYVLVEQFAQCIGMFPAGSLVELNSGEVAIMLSHNRTQRFLPAYHDHLRCE